MKHILINSFLIFGFLSLINCSTSENENAEFGGETVKVVLSKAISGETGTTAMASGKLVSKNSVNVSTRIMGYITSIPVEVGQSVKAGQLLVTINNTDIQAKGGQIDAQIMQAQAAFNSAKKDYERFQNLFNSQSASQKELDDMQARFDVAAAGLNAAKQMKNEVNAQHRYTNISAPISGVVTAKFVSQGDLANPGMPILSIESPTNLQAEVMLSENNINQIKNGMDVKVLIKSSRKEVNGKVTEISQSSTQTGGQFLVKLDLESHSDLKPGMIVNARFPFTSSNSISTDSESVMIPKSALVTKGQLRGVYTVSSQNTAILRWLKLGKEIDGQIEVLSGLKPDETYIVSAESKLFNGVKVTFQ